MRIMLIFINKTYPCLVHIPCPSLFPSKASPPGEVPDAPDPEVPVLWIWHCQGWGPFLVSAVCIPAARLRWVHEQVLLSRAGTAWMSISRQCEVKRHLLHTVH